MAKKSNLQSPVSGMTVPEMLMSFGIGRYNVPMAIQYAFMLPRTTDVFAPGAIELIAGLQRGLGLKPDGGLGAETELAIESVSGPRWRDKTWIQLYGDVMSARRRRPMTATPGYMAQDGVIGDLVSSPVPLMLGLGALYLFVWRK